MSVPTFSRQGVQFLNVNNSRSQRGIPQDSESTTEECKYSSSFTLRVVHTSWKMNQLGSSWFCKSLPHPLPFGPSLPLF